MLTLNTHLQGDLQTVFDALYEIGIIEPVLKKDWQPLLKGMEQESVTLMSALSVVNECNGQRDVLLARLRELDRQTLEILALEVAREYAGFHAREEELH